MVNTLVYIAGFVVRQILRKLSCDICRASLVRDAVPLSFDENYHLLKRKKPSWPCDSITRYCESGESCREGDSPSINKAGTNTVNSYLHPTSSRRRLDQRMCFFLEDTVWH